MGSLVQWHGNYGEGQMAMITLNHPTTTCHMCLTTHIPCHPCTGAGSGIDNMEFILCEKVSCLAYLSLVSYQFRQIFTLSLPNISEELDYSPQQIIMTCHFNNISFCLFSTLIHTFIQTPTPTQTQNIHRRYSTIQTEAAKWVRHIPRRWD